MGRDRGGAAAVGRVELELEGIAAEQQPPAGVVEHGVAVEVPGGAVQADAGGDREVVVPGPGHLQRRRPGEVRGGQGQLRVEALLQLPQRAVGMGVRGRQNVDAAQARDVVERRRAEHAGPLEEDVAAVGALQEVAVGADALHRLVPEAPRARLQLLPVRRPGLLRRRGGQEAPALARHDVAGIEAHRARGRHGEMALPEPAIGADGGRQAQRLEEGGQAWAHG